MKEIFSLLSIRGSINSTINALLANKQASATIDFLNKYDLLIGKELS